LTERIYLDSWVWIEYFSTGRQADKAEQIIESLEEKQGIISTIVILEVQYRLATKLGQQVATDISRAVESIEFLHILPVTTEVVKSAVDIRLKYYHRKTRPLSYGDAIHIATALLAKCDILYSGDSDFENIPEIPTEIV
jgi:predicted nucleic acid-binding protein